MWQNSFVSVLPVRSSKGTDFKMKIDRLFEQYRAKKAHEHGTYISAVVSTASAKQLFQWVEDNGINNPTEPAEYHATITYSRKGIPKVVNGFKYDLPIEGKIVGWKLFPTQAGGQCLVADIASKDLTNYHEDIKSKFGATHDYPSYHPHVTVSYDYTGKDVPKTFPDLTLTFDKIEAKALDPEFKPKDAKK